MPEELERHATKDASMEASKPPKKRAKAADQQQQSQQTEGRPGGAQQGGDSQRGRSESPDPMAAAEGTAYTPPRTDEEAAAPI